MQLPPELTQGIDELTRGIAPAELARASAELTAGYRGARKGRPQLDRLHQAAYLISRLPATYAVVACVLREVRRRIPGLRIESMLDLGAGPGTAMWAAAELFMELSRIVLVEDMTEWIAIGKQLSKNSKLESIRSAEWRQGSVMQSLSSNAFDLVTISYVLNELPSNDVPALARAGWQRAGKLFLIIEPGTPAGFERIREARQELIAAGAHVVAPCPHGNECPMRDGNWCRFAERLERSSEHRHAKLATLGYEDEKYSYVAVAREPISLPSARILRHPRKHSGHVELELCTVEGLKRETVSKKQGAKYKDARKAGWGDAL
ncbi:MAG TPA: small ribosomal subunit Rsm22 family protein [Terriglobales bacterium]|jgi:ribosomal protein RSM22 (predicted rRNA methylase)|nr:small ribosomal subunit Rsm22 family protein [Terriglobales bacterium]